MEAPDMNYLDKLVSEINQGVSSEPPKGSFTTDDFAKRSGLSATRAGAILRGKERVKELRRVKVRRGCALVSYWVEAK
jgi:hypothetical protein